MGLSDILIMDLDPYSCSVDHCGQILQYLAAHPDAKDTVDGILKWWLPSHPSDLDKEQVQEALDALVAEGWLVKRVLPSSRELYSLNKKGRQEIEVFLKTPQSKADLEPQETI